MTLLPEQWKQAYLSELAALKTGPFGSTLHKSDYSTGGIPVVNPMHIVGVKIVPSAAVTVAPETVERLSEFRLQRGDVILGRRGEMGRCAVVGEAEHGWLCGTGSLIIRPGIILDPHYLQRFLSSPAVISCLEEASVGSTMVNLNQKILLELEVPIPPLAEQKRIADKLDAVLAQVDACRERLDHVPAILKRFRQAVLAAATSGQLTEDWREAHDDSITSKGLVTVSREALPPGWWWSCPEEIKARERYSLAIGPFGSNLKVKDYRPTGVPLVFVKEIRTRNFGGLGTKFISEEKALELAAYTISGGDLLITKMGDPPGDTAIYPKGTPDAVITADCIKLRVNELIAHPVFVSLVIESPSFRERLQEITAGIAQQKISLERFRRFPLQLAPIAEQHEIVHRVEALFAYADRLEARYTAVRAQVERLTPALLAKAFRGELVPQDSNDEPASVLLERIRAARSGWRNSRPQPAQRRRPPQDIAESRGPHAHAQRHPRYTPNDNTQGTRPTHRRGAVVRLPARHRRLL